MDEPFEHKVDRYWNTVVKLEMPIGHAIYAHNFLRKPKIFDFIAIRRMR